jgi:hypothetical protein
MKRTQSDMKTLHHRLNRKTYVIDASLASEALEWQKRCLVHPMPLAAPLGAILREWQAIKRKMNKGKD